MSAVCVKLVWRYLVGEHICAGLGGSIIFFRLPLCLPFSSSTLTFRVTGHVQSTPFHPRLCRVLTPFLGTILERVQARCCRRWW